MAQRAVSTDAAPMVGFSTGTKAPLSQAVVYNGFVYVSGQGPLDAETHTIVSDDFEEQTRVTLENMVRVVEAAGSSKDRILKCNCYIKDIGFFPTFNAAYRAFFEGVPTFPARTTVVASPPREGVLVEVECVAAAGEAAA